MTNTSRRPFCRSSLDSWRLTAAIGLAIAAIGPPRQAGAQFLARPSLPWRQLDTPRFTFTFPVALEEWTRDVASRIESVDSAVSGVIGYTPRRRVRIVVDDPFNVSNGYALPFLDQPVITFWATPPSPRQDIGNYRAWGEMLATHEFAHIAHLARPSRNARLRFLTQLLPVRLGPIPASAPRWVQEGYATYVEGRVTGSGRPNHAWRAAILRQWALEGRLPTYDQLSSWGDFNGGDFAYLAGSAFLEWLTAREGVGGDTSLVNVWRRLTARQRRTFDDAFAGVFGDTPRTLYGRFTVDLTARALEVRRVRGATPVEGELIQRETWATGDPAVSRDGGRVAVVLRAKGRPSRVVVWRAVEPPDTTAAKAAAELLKRDPEDVPARRIFPPVRKPVATLLARHGRSFEDPRFLGDAKHLLVWRNVVRSDGSSRPDIYLWDTESGQVRRVTRDASVREPDPSPDGHVAAAVRCEAGRCDLVSVDLSSGDVIPIVSGSISSSLYRPRWSPDGHSIAVAIQRGARWRIAVVDAASRQMRFVDPDEDGATRYDAAWLSPTSIVCVSERSGIGNLERIDLETGAVQTLTNVTGAAVAPEPNPADHSIWFLSLHSRGYDVRRLAEADVREPVPEVPRAGDSTLTPALPPPAREAIVLGRGPVGPTRPYEVWPGSLFWLPSGDGGADGVSAGIALASSDIVGRLSLLLKGLLASDGAWRGGALAARWRGWRPSLDFSGYWASQLPSRARTRSSTGDSLDVRLSGARMSVSLDLMGDGWEQALRVGAGTGRLRSLATSRSDTRTTVFARAATRLNQTGDGQSLSELMAVEGTVGDLGGQRFNRWWVSGGISTGGSQMLPLDLSVRYGRVSSDAPYFERLALGGLPSPIVDEDLLSQRVALPALPTAAAVGHEVLSYRIALRSPFTPYVASTRIAAPGLTAQWYRSYGAELSLGTIPLPALHAPGGHVLLGAARARDGAGTWHGQVYGGVLVEP